VPLQAPELDDRTFDQLVANARLRIPRYTDQWTDFNDSDPGMTLVQLFAWLTEMLLHRMNQVPDRNYIKFLQLLNLELEPARPAEAYLTFKAKPGAANPPIIRAGTQVGAQPPDGGDMLIFETAETLALTRLPLEDVQVYDGAAFSKVSVLNNTPGTAFRPLGWVPQPNSALYLGFGTKEDVERGEARFPQKLHLHVFLLPEAAAARPQLCGRDNQPPAPPVQLVWEYRPKATSARWRRLDSYRDDSAAFTREGDVLIAGPQDSVPTQEGRMQAEDQKRFWLRCRLDSGVYPAGRVPEIDFIRPNTIKAENRATVREERVGISDGRPDQRMELRRKPVLPKTLELRVEIAGEDARIWQRVDDFLASGPDDLHYTLNHNSGEIRFGDGRRGEIPPASAEVVAQVYIYGGGAAGNLGPNTINALLTSSGDVESVTNERPAAGGKNEQKLDDLREEAPARIRCRDRAVTTEDFAALAQQAGGVARSTAIALAHPDYPGIEVPGAITVVVVPDNQDTPPRPSAELLSAVCRYLDERRLLGTEVYVKAPTYREISVEARVEPDPYASPDQLIEDIKRELDAFFDPLGRSAGTQGAAPTASAAKPTGWTFGQHLHPTELYSVILNVVGVRSVPSLALIVDGRPHDDIRKTVYLGPDELIYGRDHMLVVVPAKDR
jgi:predicted phage baseplate assembly protein